MMIEKTKEMCERLRVVYLDLQDINLREGQFADMTVSLLNWYRDQRESEAEMLIEHIRTGMEQIHLEYRELNDQFDHLIATKPQSKKGGNHELL